MNAHVVRTLTWWLGGSLLLLAALWSGPHAWAAPLGNCGQSTVPGPCAVDDGAGAEYQTPVTIAVLANDQDRSATGLHITTVTTAAHGTTLHDGQVITYTPAASFSGADTFSYRVADGLGIEAEALVVVFVAAQQQQKPDVRPVDPLTDSVAAFTETVRLPDGGTVAVTTTVAVPAGAFTFTLRPTDTLAIVFRPIVTPTGDVGAPPVAAALPASPASYPAAHPAAQGVAQEVAQEIAQVVDQPGTLPGTQPGTQPASGQAAWYGRRWSGLSFRLDALLNQQPLGALTLARPLTIEVGYDPRLLAQLEPRSLTPYYWAAGAWSQTGVTVVARRPEAGKIVFTVDRIVGELSFFARPPLVYLPDLRRH